jgi:hypothetical protein
MSNKRAGKHPKRRVARWTTRAAVMIALSCLLVTLLSGIAIAGQNPVLVGRARTESGPSSVCVQGSYAYVVNFSSNILQVFDISNPAKPEFIGTAGTDSHPVSACIQGSNVYVVNFDALTLQVFDVSNPRKPTLVGSSGVSTRPFSICSQGSYAYVVGGGSLHVFDVSRPDHPVLNGRGATNATSVSVEGQFAYAVDASELQVWDIRDPMKPGYRLGTRAVGSRSVCVRGDYAYVISSSSGKSTLGVYRVPGLPARLIGVADTGSAPESLCLQGNNAYVVTKENKLQVFDVADPKSPRLKGSASTDARPWSVCVQGSFVYTVSLSDTLQVFQVNPDPPTMTSPTAYLAEGTNAWGFSTYITIENPNDTPVQARLTYMDPNAPTGGKVIAARRTIILPPLSQTTVSSAVDIGNVDFSTEVECLQDKPIAVDRTMFWTGPGYSGAQSGYHCSVGAASPSTVWFLPEGSSAWGFETWTLVQNPNDTAAEVTLTYMTETGGAKQFSRTVPANSRASYSMASDIGGADASIRLTSDQPVIAERSMYRNNRREGSCSVGATDPSADCFLAEGACGYDVGFVTYVLVQNPNDTANDVSLTYQTGKGEVPGPSFAMAPNSRKTVRVNDTLPTDTNVSTHVHGSAPLIAERSMYWDNGTGEAFHASIGTDSPCMSYYLPDGQTSNGFETWTLVENPNPGAVRVRISYLPQGGGKSVTFTDEIPANARATYNMADKVPSGRASIMVQSLDGARPVIVERSMYMNNRGAGTNTIGACSDDVAD